MVKYKNSNIHKALFDDYEIEKKRSEIMSKIRQKRDVPMNVALEEFKDIPFKVKRVYYMYDTGKDVTRGFHAHKKLEQILICIYGSCKIRLDNGFEKKVVPLEKPYEGLYVSNSMWREMFDFSEDAVLMVLASELYDEADYIRSYKLHFHP